MSRMPTWRLKIPWKPQPALTTMSDLIMSESGSSIWPQRSGRRRSGGDEISVHLLQPLALTSCECTLHPPAAWNALQKEGSSEDSAATFVADNLTLLMVRLTASPFLSASPLSRLLAVEPRFHMDAWARVRWTHYAKTKTNWAQWPPRRTVTFGAYPTSARNTKTTQACTIHSHAPGRRIWWDLSSTLYYFPVPGLSSNQNQLLIIHRQSCAQGAHTRRHTQSCLWKHTEEWFQ